MKTFTASGLGRVLIVNLSRGDRLLESIATAVREAGLRDGIVMSAIGSLQKARFHRVTSFAEQPEDEFVTLEKPIELASLQGLIVDYQPHFHMVISDRENAYTGHLEEETIVAYLSEITIAELKGVSLQRARDRNNIAKLATRDGARSGAERRERKG
jgi:predicted DNA-binding protein with PD1-like motif